MKKWTPKDPPYHPGRGKAPELPHADSPLESENQIDHWAFLLGVNLHNQGYHWEAHEVWESLWHLQSGASKDFLKILIQLTAAHLKINLKEMDAAQRLTTSLSGYLKELIREKESLCGINLKDFGIQVHEWINAPDQSKGILQIIPS